MNIKLDIGIFLHLRWLIHQHRRGSSPNIVRRNHRLCHPISPVKSRCIMICFYNLYMCVGSRLIVWHSLFLGTAARQNPFSRTSVPRRSDPQTRVQTLAAEGHFATSTRP